MKMKGGTRIQTVLLAVILGTLCSSNAFAQLYPVVGFQVKPIIPSELFSNTSFKGSADNVTFTINPTVGYNFGMIIRKAVYKGISIEGGLTYTQRTYGVSATDSTGFSTSTQFKLVTYEIPLMALFYIHIAPNDYIDGAFGGSADFFASDVESKSADGTIDALTKVKYWVLPALNSAVGYEHRTKTSGYFYIGGSYHRMLTDLAYTAITFQRDTKNSYIIEPLAGHYFALDFKYFLPVTQKTVNPEDQNGL